MATLTRSSLRPIDYSHRVLGRVGVAAPAALTRTHITAVGHERERGAALEAVPTVNPKVCARRQDFEADAPRQERRMETE